MYWSAVDGHVIYESAEATSVGTIAHAAPEQLMGENIDGRADRYALAAMTYHLLTGTLLNSTTNPAVVISRRDGLDVHARLQPGHRGLWRRVCTPTSIMPAFCAAILIVRRAFRGTASPSIHRRASAAARATARASCAPPHLLV